MATVGKTYMFEILRGLNYTHLTQSIDEASRKLTSVALRLGPFRNRQYTALGACTDPPRRRSSCDNGIDV